MITIRQPLSLFYVFFVFELLIFVGYVHFDDFSVKIVNTEASVRFVIINRRLFGQSAIKN